MINLIHIICNTNCGLEVESVYEMNPDCLEEITPVITAIKSNTSKTNWPSYNYMNIIKLYPELTSDQIDYFSDLLPRTVDGVYITSISSIEIYKCISKDKII
jgi:hypothetical protein